MLARPRPRDDALVAAGPPGAILRSNADGSAWQVRALDDIEAERAFPWVLADREAQSARGRRGARRACRFRATAAATGRAVQIARAARTNWPFWQGALLDSRGTLLVAGKGGLAARSTDGGAQLVDASTPARDKDLYGSFADRIAHVPDRARTARCCAPRTRRDVEQRRLGQRARSCAACVRDARSGALICFGAHGAIVRSTDAGLSWRAVPSGTDGVLRKALVEPGTGDLLLVGGQGTLLRSRRWRTQLEVLPTHTHAPLQQLRRRRPRRRSGRWSVNASCASCDRSPIS